MKKAIKPIIFICVTLALAGAVGVHLKRTLAKPPLPPRTVATRIGEMVVTVSETGTIEPVNKVDVRSKVAGRLLSIPIQEGQSVTKGQVIATVDRTLIDPQIARSRAQLLEAQGRLQQSIATYNLQKQQTRVAIVQAEANLSTALAHLAAARAPARLQEVAQQREAVERATIALADAQRTQKRKQGLLAKGYIAQADSDTAQTALDTAQSNLATARQQLALTKAGPRPEDINSAKADVAAARVQLESARVNELQLPVSQSGIVQAQSSVQQSNNDLAQLTVQLNDTQIIAPVSAIVLKKYKEVNEIVQSATTGFSDTQSLVATLGSEPIIRVEINEVDISKVHLNDAVHIHVDALPEAPLEGHISEIAPASTNAFSSSSGGSQTSISKFSVKVSFDVPDARLRPGMTANVNIIGAHHAGAVLASLETIPFVGNRGTVTVLTATKHQEKRQVVLGRRNDTDVEILSGLRAGEQLVAAPLNAKDRRTINFNDGPG